MFADLTPSNVHYGAELPFMTDNLSQLDADGVAEAGAGVGSIFIEAARDGVRTDLYDAWGMDIEDPDVTDDFEDRVSAASSHIKHAIADRQMWLMYEHFDQGHGSLNRERLIQYRTRYERRRSRFAGLGKPSGRMDVQSVEILI